MMLYAVKKSGAGNLGVPAREKKVLAGATKVLRGFVEEAAIVRTQDALEMALIRELGP